MRGRCDPKWFFMWFIKLPIHLLGVFQCEILREMTPGQEGSHQMDVDQMLGRHHPMWFFMRFLELPIYEHISFHTGHKYWAFLQCSVWYWGKWPPDKRWAWIECAGQAWSNVIHRHQRRNMDESRRLKHKMGPISTLFPSQSAHKWNQIKSKQGGAV